MKINKNNLQQRKSVFDRMLVVLMGLSCVFLVNIIAKPCAQAMGAFKDHRHASESTFNSWWTKPSAVEEKKENSKPSLKGSDDSSKSENDGGWTGDKKEDEKKKEKSSWWGSSSGNEKKESKKDEGSTPLGGDNNKDESESSGLQPASENKKESKIKVKPPSPPSSGKTSKKPKSLWKNRYKVVHVMWSRFMQLQPDLMHLGKARIELFKTFTLRSMREQSTQEYLWIIFTDPELEPALLNEIIDLVKIHPNILLVGMNAGFKDFRHPGWTGGIETVFSGDMQMLKDYQEAARTHVYVETRIDCDDSMYQDFMRRVQIQAAKSLGEAAKEANYDEAILAKTPQFLVACAHHSLEWGFMNPWEPESKKGHLFGVTAPEFCITAGLTYAFQIGTKPDDVVVAHHRLDKTHPQCRGEISMNCIDRIDAGDFKYVVLRSRTPTSAGMAGVIPTNAVKHSTEWRQMQDQVWDQYIFRNFGTTPKSIFELRKFLMNDMENILKDALDGQCTRADFTCKKSSRDDLMNLLNEVKKHTQGSSSGGEAAAEA